MKKRYIKMFVINIVVSILSIVVLTILGNSIIGTIAFAIWGEQKGWLATNIIIRILMPLFLALGIHLQNIRNEKDFDDCNGRHNRVSRRRGRFNPRIAGERAFEKRS